MTLGTQATQALEKLTEKVPSLDGSFRRRFISGGLLTFSLFVALYPQLEKNITDNFSDLLDSSVLTVAFLVLIYSFGALIEMIGELFIVRLASGATWVFRFPEKWRNKPKPTRLILGFFWFSFSPYLLYIGFFRGVLGFSIYSLDIPGSLSDVSKEYYNNLPQKIRTGFSKPLGDSFEFSFKYLQNNVQETSKNWMTKLDARNKELLSILSSLLISAFIMFSPIEQLLISIAINEYQGMPIAFISSVVLYDPETRIIVISVIIPLFFTFLFHGYFKVLRRSIISALELSGHEAKESDSP